MDVQTFRDRQQSVQLEGLIDDPLTIAYTDIGEGEPLVLLHGIPTWSFLFHKVIEPLAAEYRVITPDLAGFGYSDRRDCFDRSIAFQADVIERFLDHLEIDNAHFVAHDIGGGVALILADRSPGMVRSLVLSNTVAYDSWPIQEMLSLGHPKNTKMKPDELREMLEETFTVGLSRPEQRTDEFREGIMAPYLNAEGITSLVRNAAALNTNHTTALTGRMKLIEQPTLLLWGEDDEWQPISTAHQMVADMPHASLHAISNCSHWVPQDASDEFAQATLKFLREHANAGV